MLVLEDSEDTMLVLTGFFENDRLISNNPISIPQKKMVKVTIEEVQNAEQSENVMINYADDLLKASESSLSFWDNEYDRVWDNV